MPKRSNGLLTFWTEALYQSKMTISFPYYSRSSFTSLFTRFTWLQGMLLERMENSFTARKKMMAFILYSTWHLICYCICKTLLNQVLRRQAVRMHPDIDCLMDRLVATCFRGLVTTCAFLRVYGLESFRVKKASSII